MRQHTHDVTTSAKSNHTDSAADGGTLLGTSQCSACATCCVGAIIAPTLMDWGIVRNDSHPVLIPPPFLVSGYIPDGLKRPPKALLV